MDNCSNFLSSLPDNISDAEIWSLLLEDERKEAVTKIPAFVYMALLIILGLPGNVIVLIVYKSRFRPSTTKCFIMAMAAFDLCSCLLAMPFEIVDIRLDFELDIPVGCRVMRFLVAVFAYGSILVLIGVAVDRFQRVCRPYSRQMTVKNSKTGIAVMIGIAVTFSLPNLIFYGRQTIKFRSLTLVDCSIDDQFSESVLPKIYFVFQGLCWVLAILVLSITYGFIIYNIKKANQRRYRLDSSTSTNTVNHVGMSNMNSGPHRKNSVQKLPVGTSLENTALSSKTKTKTKTKTRSNSTCSNGGKDDMQTEKQGKATQANTGNKGDKSNNSPKSNPGTPRRSSNWKSNAFMRLFSRDVNPVDLVDQPEDAQQTPTSRGSSISVTLHEREEEILTSGLQDVEEERNGMEDGVSLQNLIPDENSSDDAPEDGTSTVSGTPKKGLGTIHISASEGDHLADSEGLNNYHKLLSESLQRLNDMKTDSEFNGLEGCRLNHRPKSMDHLSCKAKTDQLNTEDVSSVCDTETEGSTNFRRSKTFPVRKNSSLTNPEGSRKSKHSDENDKSIREHEDISLEIDKSDRTIPPKKETTFITSNSDDKNDKNSKSLTGPFHVSQTSDVDKASPNEEHRDSKDRLANSPQGSSDVKKKEVNNTNSILSTSKDSFQQQTQPNNNNNKSNNAPRKTSRSTSFQRQISSCSTDITSSRSAIVKRKQMKELKTSKLAMMMFHVTLGFVISYLPHLSIQIAKILHPDGVSALMCDAYFFGLYHVALRSIYLNHTINPLIYGYYNKRFRQYCVGFLTSPLRFLRKSPSSVPDRSSISMEQT